MGRLARVLDFVRGEFGSRVKADPGAGANTTAPHLSPVGDDAVPLPGDFVVVVQDRGAGREIAVGYADPLNAESAQPGEKRTYSRDAEGGQVAEIWLKTSGEISISNGTGNLVLGASGVITLNGVEIDVSGNITTPGVITSNGKNLSTHTHGILGGSSSPGPTGVNT